MTARALILGMALVLGITGCARVADSRFNPFNWFGGSEAEAAAAAPAEVDTDPRARVQQVTSLRIEPTPTGAIVRATALPPTQGWYEPALVPETDGPVNGEMVYVFRALPPPDPERVSTAQSRELSAARTLSQQALADTRLIRVIGAENALVTRR